jgi:hypothetical protein
MSEIIERPVDYCREIRARMSEGWRLHRQAEEHKTVRGRDVEWRRLQSQIHLLHLELERLQLNAAKAFAALNGWRWTEREFLVKTLARGGAHDHGYYYDALFVHDFFDHPVFFRELTRPYRSAAIVGQPYNTELAAAIEFADRVGLKVSAPPNLTASWWNPGSTRFFCFTRPGPEVRFLPDQESKVEEVV